MGLGFWFKGLEIRVQGFVFRVSGFRVRRLSLDFPHT